jgi:predicted dehydrogenase
MKAKRTQKKRYAVVGTGGRSRMFVDALLSTYKKGSALVALCDSNPLRMAYYNERFGKLFGLKPLPAYAASDFEQMIAETRPDVVIVTSMDRTHHEYIIRAMELGCDVVTEKPMTIDAPKCQAILDAVNRTGRKVRVAFNYRYSPVRTKVKELIMNGEIGDVKSVHFEWLLDTQHGADYFRRWHRDKRNSGGLMVHKSTHHFDLVNWWLDSAPETVFGFGSLAFYGRANAESRGDYRPYVHSTDAPAAKGDPFAIDLRDGATLEGLYYHPAKADAYRRDQNVFGDGISIEDTMNVLVRYQSGAQLSYSLTAYSPWEGYRIAFNGTKGRIELDERENSYINSGGGIGEGVSQSSQILLFPHGEKPRKIDVQMGTGGHGGGDTLLLNDLFGAQKRDKFHRAAGHLEGALSILTGIAANRSFETGQAVDVRSLVRFPNR